MHGPPRRSECRANEHRPILVAEAEGEPFGQFRRRMRGRGGGSCGACAGKSTMNASLPSRSAGVLENDLNVMFNDEIAIGTSLGTV